jgi:hypothetical protein
VAWRGGKTDLTQWNAGIGMGKTATIFFQMKAVGTGTYSIMTGLSPSAATIATTDAWADFAVMPYVDGVAGSTLAYRMNDAGLANNVIFNMSTDVWYNVWLVIDNAAQTYSVYYSTGTNNGTFGGHRHQVLERPCQHALGRPRFHGQRQFHHLLAAVDNVYRLHGVNTSYPIGSSGEPVLVPETLTVASDFTLSAGSTLELDVSAGSVHDKLAVSAGISPRTAPSR